MYYNEKRIPEKEVANCFAAYFEEKVDLLLRIHKMNNRAMPKALMTYKTAIQLPKLNGRIPLTWLNTTLDTFKV